VLEAFSRLIDVGKVRVLGASNFSAMRFKSANDAATAAGLPRYHVLQPEYNLISRHKFEGELQDYCVTENVGVLPYYGLAAGFLTGKYRKAEDFGKSVRGARMGDRLAAGEPVLAAMDSVAAETGASLATIALAWLIAQDGVTAPIASASKPEQLPELLAAMTLELNEAQLARLVEAGV
jgi:aryl-alcohol dehydrogenase-like predicted oxidoreductase